MFRDQADEPEDGTKRFFYGKGGPDTLYWKQVRIPAIFSFFSPASHPLGEDEEGHSSVFATKLEHPRTRPRPCQCMKTRP